MIKQDKMEEEITVNIEKSKDGLREKSLVEEIIVAEKEPKSKENSKSLKINQLANVKCLECHCTGTVMKTIDGMVLFPHDVKKTLLELERGMLMPDLKKAKPTLEIANQKVKKFVEGFNELGNEQDDGSFKLLPKKIHNLKKKISRGIENAKNEKGTEIVKIFEKENSKTPSRYRPEKYRGWFSDEFEPDKFWKSNKRLSLQ